MTYTLITELDIWNTARSENQREQEEIEFEALSDHPRRAGKIYDEDGSYVGRVDQYGRFTESR